MSLRTATDMTLRQNVEDALYQFDRLNNDASQAAWARRYGRPMIEALISRQNDNPLISDAGTKR